MNDDEIPASPHHRKRKGIAKHRSGSKKIKPDDEVQNNQDVSQSQQNIIRETLSAVDASNNNNVTSARTSNGSNKLLTRHDILKYARLMEKANVPVSSQYIRKVIRNPMTDFCSVTQLMKCNPSSSVVKLDEDNPSSAFSANAQFNEAMESQSGITVTQLNRIVDEADKYLDARVHSSHDSKINKISDDVNSITVRERTKDTHSIDFVQRTPIVGSEDIVENRNVSNTVDNINQHSIVQSILNDWSSPVKSKDTQYEEGEITPKFIIYRRIKKTYSRKRMAVNEISVGGKQLHEFNIPSPSASNCSAITLESDNDEENMQQKICHETTNVTKDDIDLNKSVHVMDNIQNLSKYYSQSSEIPDQEAVNKTFALLMDLKCRNDETLQRTRPSESQSLRDEEDFLGFDNKMFTLTENFDTILSSSDDKMSVWSKNSSINQNSTSGHSPLKDNHVLWQDDDDLFAEYRTQYNIPNFKPEEPEPSTSASALKHVIGNSVNGKAPQDIGSKATKGSATNFFNNCSDSIKLTSHAPSSSIITPTLNKGASVPDQFVGFRTVRGAAIKLSEKATKKMNSLFDDIELECGEEFGGSSSINISLQNESSKNELVSKRTNSSYGGSSTVRQDQIPVSIAKIPKAAKFFDDVEPDETNLIDHLFDDAKRECELEIDRPSKKQSNSKTSTTVGTTNPPYARFSTATGNQIPVSMTRMSKSAKIFDDVMKLEPGTKLTNCLFDDIAQEYQLQIDRPSDKQPHGTTNGMSNPPYATARGNQILVSTAKMPKTANIFDDLEMPDETKSAGHVFDDVKPEYGLEIDQLSEKQPNSKISTTGGMTNPPYASFSTARGNQIPVSMARMSKSAKVFDDVMKLEPETMLTDRFFDDIERKYELKVDRPLEIPPNSKNSTTNGMPNPPYATTRGNQIPISMAKMPKTANIFDDIEMPDATKFANHLFDKRKYGLEIDQLSEKQPNSKFITTDGMTNPPYASFATARGNKIPVSMARMSKSAKVFDDVMKLEPETKLTDRFFDDIERKYELKVDRPSEIEPNSKNSTTGGVSNPYATARGNQIPVSMEKISKSVRIFEEQAMEQPLVVPNEIASKRNQCIVFNSANSFLKPSPLRKDPTVDGLRKFEIEHSKENVNVELNSSLRRNDIENDKFKIRSPKTSDHNGFLTPINNLKTWTQEARESAEVLWRDDERSSFMSKQICSADLSDGFHAFESVVGSSTPIHTNNHNRNKPRQTRLVELFDDIAREDSGEHSIQNDLIKFEVPEYVLSARKFASEAQYRSTINKANVSPLPGTLYTRKLISTKMMWKDFVDKQWPSNGAPHPKVSKSVLNITSENATKFKFNAWDHYPEEFCRENINGIRLKDDINVIMDGICKIGINEISNAFLSCPTVDPKLIHDKWIENNFRWILIKFAGMERSFPDQFGGQILTLDNVMLELKHRYDREIDHVERSAIRKICEMDDTAAKRMILFVATVNVGQNGCCELELSDGWYSLFSTLDNQMNKIVNDGKIKVGTKLIVQGAELTGLDGGCNPLDVPSNVRLKICANSTRRAKWDTKLGYCKNPGPFTISLNSVLGDGGRITKLKIFILRVYPIVYIDMTNKSCIHSEKVEKRRTMNEEQNYLNIVEKVYSQVCCEYNNEEKSERAEGPTKAMPKPTHISEITDPETLYELIENSNDPNYIENEMTESQKVMYVDHKTKLNARRNDEINSRVQEKLASINKMKRKSVPVLKLKITDVKSIGKTAILTIWSPPEELSIMLKEGTALEMINSAARGIKSNELQIYAGKSAIFVKLNSDQCQMPDSLRRRHSSISEISSIVQPMFNELDTTGIVVSVGDVTSAKFQPVYIADHDHNILCINFWNSVKEYAYDDVIQPKRFLAITNLQWRTSSSNTAIRSIYATEFSIFTENPKSAELLHALTTLKMKFETIALDSFVETCVEKILEIKSTKSTITSTSTPLRTWSNLSSMSSPATSLPRTPSNTSTNFNRSALSIKSRIDRLSRFGDPLQTPPLHIKSVNKSFKPPARNK